MKPRQISPFEPWKLSDHGYKISSTMGHSSEVMSEMNAKIYWWGREKNPFLNSINISCRLVPWEEGKFLRHWFCTNSTSVFQNTKGNLHTCKVILQKSLLSSLTTCNFFLDKPLIEIPTNLTWVWLWPLILTTVTLFAALSSLCPLPNCLVSYWSDVLSLFLLPLGHHCKCECFKLWIETNWRA